MKTSTLTLAVCALLNGWLSAATTVFYELDYETPNQAFTGSYGYAGYGIGSPNTNVQVSVSTATSQTGPGNPGNASEVTADFTAMGAIPTATNYSYDGFGHTIASNTLPTPVSFAPGDLNNMYLEFDYFIAGANSGVTSITANLDLDFRAPLGTAVAPGPSSGVTNADSAYSTRVNNISLTTGSWQTLYLPVLSLPIDTADTVTPTSLATFDTFAAAIEQMQFNLNINSNGAFGFDNDNALLIDNFRLISIPEPSRAVLLAFGMVALFSTRRPR